jgi:hypothetical protein
MKRALWPLLMALALGGGAGCRGPGWYADKSPLEIAEMVDVELERLGPGEAGYSAPVIASSRRYRLSGRKDLDSGQSRHALRLSEFGSAEERSSDWSRATAERRACRLQDAAIAGSLAGGRSADTTFATLDQQTSCTPYRDCETYERTYKKRYKDKDGDRKTKLVERVFRECRDIWRCQSERRYDVTVGDRALRQASALPDGMQVELRWDCAGRGEPREVIELPAAYLQGYLLAVDGYPYAPRPGEIAP